MKYFIDDIIISSDSDRFIREVLIGKEYRYLFKYNTVLDVGANIGAFSYFIYPNADRIYAIEPNPKAVRHLRRTVKENNLNKVFVHELAISSTTGERLLKDANDEHREYGAGKINDREGLTVKCSTLNDFVKDQKVGYIDLLKIDTEGSEDEILSYDGLDGVGIGTIIGEYHGGEKRDKIATVLTSLGYNFVDLQPRFIARKK